MRRRKQVVITGMIVFLLLAFLFMADVIFLILMQESWDRGKNLRLGDVIDGLSETAHGFELSEDIQNQLIKNQEFAMLLNDDGVIIWSYDLPQELDRVYTMQDVARFSRYYLDDYPVHTWICEQGLLVIGEQKNTVWKYTLEFKVSTVEKMWKWSPWILAMNIALLVAVPIYVWQRMIKKQEMERTEWIAGVSHDVRTPLALILGEASAIRRESGDEVAIRRATAIEHQGIRIRTLVANMNMSNKLDYGMGDYPAEKYKIGALFREILADIMNRNIDNGLTMDLDVSKQVEQNTIKVNKELFRRLLENLINNSLQHNTGEVCVRIEVDRSNAFLEKYQISIVDDGKGASEEQLKQMNRRNSDYKLGEHGMGLRLVRKIVRFHHWKIQFSANELQGLKCDIYIR